LSKKLTRRCFIRRCWGGMVLSRFISGSPVWCHSASATDDQIGGQPGARTMFLLALVKLPAYTCIEFRDRRIDCVWFMAVGKGPEGGSNRVTDRLRFRYVGISG